MSVICLIGQMDNFIPEYRYLYFIHQGGGGGGREVATYAIHGLCNRNYHLTSGNAIFNETCGVSMQ